MRASDFEQLLESVREMGRIRRGEQAPARVTRAKLVNPRTLRRKLGQTQQEFALMIGVSVATVRNWEQGRRRPEGPALVLLQVVEADPHAVFKALHRPRRSA